MKTKYQMLMEDLILKIENGEIKDGDKFYSENELVKEYDVSRVTVRKAYEELEKNGYIYREQGKGTFVERSDKRSKMMYKASVQGYSVGISAQGFQVNTITKEKKIIEADAVIAKKLDIKVGDKILIYGRVYYADQDPVIYAKSYINLQALAGIESYDFEFISYSKVLNQYFHVSELESTREMYAGLAGEVAVFLDTDENMPIVIEHTTQYGKLPTGRKKLEYAKTYARTDKKGYFYQMVL